MTSSDEREMNTRLQTILEPGGTAIHEEGPRRSGKTYRSMLRCLTAASLGSSVLYVAGNHRSAKYAFDLASRLAYQESTLDMPNLSVRFPNGGLLTIDYVRSGRVYHGKRYSAVAKDY